jgi:hypothetical protein
MSQRREDLRVADVDRAFVAERLKAAVDEGRLSLLEYDERLRDAYAAKTYGDLDRLLHDLPNVSRPAAQQLRKPDTASPVVGSMPVVGEISDPAGGRRLGVPRWLAAVWGAWIFAVSVNVMIWFLVSVSRGDAVYFWPMWVAGPWGAVLLATTVMGFLTGAPNQPDRRDGGAERHRAERREARRAARRTARAARRGRY